MMSGLKIVVGGNENQDKKKDKGFEFSDKSVDRVCEMKTELVDKGFPWIGIRISLAGCKTTEGEDVKQEMKWHKQETGNTVEDDVKIAC